MSEENPRKFSWRDVATAVAALAVLGMLFVIFVPASHGPGSGRRAVCINNQAQLALAAVSFETVHRRFPGGVIMAFADKHTQFVRETIDYRVYQQLLTPHSALSHTPHRQIPLKPSDIE